MSLSRIKLLQYLSILRKGLPPGTSREAIQALDGIQEVNYRIYFSCYYTCIYNYIQVQKHEIKI